MNLPRTQEELVIWKLEQDNSEYCFTHLWICERLGYNYPGVELSREYNLFRSCIVDWLNELSETVPSVLRVNTANEHGSVYVYVCNELVGQFSEYEVAKPIENAQVKKDYTL